MKVQVYEGATLSLALQRAFDEAGASAEVVEVRRARDRVEVAVSVPGAELGQREAARLPGPNSLPERRLTTPWRGRSTRPSSDLETHLRALGLRPRRRNALLAGRAPDRATLTRRMARHISCEEEPSLTRPPTRSGEPRILVLVGPTGVGKTTTVAKLAAQVHLGWGPTGKPAGHRRRLRLGLVTLDTFRVGAVEQLSTYADLLGAPIKVAETPAHLVSAIRELSDCDLILVDTAGRSPRDRSGLRQLERALARLPQAEVLLTLPATSRLAELYHAELLYAGCKPAALILTKLDEAVATGDAFELLARTHLPVRLLCDGQQVPDDLHVASSLGVARWILDPSGCCA
ncbi:MAG: hypothetical protein JKY65_22205 [Planctomycetes bacterium]|nr:hypothetical protein [Planctomycetota bacterium]